MRLGPNLYRTFRTRLPLHNRTFTRITTAATVTIGSSISSQAMSSNAAPPVQKSEDEWRAILSKEQFRVLRQKGTERPGTGEYEHTKDDGTHNSMNMANSLAHGYSRSVYVCRQVRTAVDREKY
jgi:SelR domain